MIPVPFIEYINVRIKGFHSHLFTRDTYEDLLSGDSLVAVTTYLLNNPRYGGDIERALGGRREREGLEHGVTDYFARVISDLLDMASGTTFETFRIVMYSFDLKNIRSVVLGHSKGLPFQEVKNMIVPCGSLRRSDCATLLAVPDITGMIPLLSRRLPFAAETLAMTLREAGDRDKTADLLNRFEVNFYSRLMQRLYTDSEDMSVIRNVYSVEIDMKNVLSVLKFIWERRDRDWDIERDFAHGGKISLSFLNDMLRCPSLDEAFEMLEKTPFHTAVEKGIIYYAETGFLHEMERFFEEIFIRKTQMYRRCSPFGIGVFISYVWAQFIELTNLRTIINGIAFRAGPGQIRKGLVYV